jgi:hypothetical protein
MLPVVEPLPAHAAKEYLAAGTCIYCGAAERLTNEHIIPFSAGGKWVLPQASIDWEIAQVDRRVCPFLVLLPLYPMPELMTGMRENGERTSATGTYWIRGGGFWPNRDAHMQWLCTMLGATDIMPTGTVNAEPYCLTILKVAHSFAMAELGMCGFQPLLAQMILKRDLSERAAVLGGGGGNEPPSTELHEVGFVACSREPSVIVVRVRLFAALGTPSHHVVVGRRP